MDNRSGVIPQIVAMAEGGCGESQKPATVFDFLSKIVRLLQDEEALQPRRNDQVVQFQHPRELQELLPLALNKDPLPDDDIVEACRQVIKYSVKTNHPYFFNQLYGGVDMYGLAGTWISESLNTNQYTFEVGPAFTLVEHAVLTHTLNMFGLANGDGIFCPGGSISNMYGIVLARYKKVPDIKTKGLSSAPPLVAFTSDDGHYSMLKAAHWLGLGTDNMIKVKSDNEGRMIPSELVASIQNALKAGKQPFFVNATAGTTVLGAFDPFEALADICTEYQLWLHVDACWGGSLMLSKKFSSVLKGISRADSISWNPHKMLGAPLQCSAFLVREKGLLHHSNAAAAHYLFQQDKFYDISYDTGDKSVQCGRKVDALKLWLMWKARGDSGLEKVVDNAMECARYFCDRIRNRPGFRLVIPEFQCTNTCFWYIPPRLRNQEETPEWWEKINSVAPKIKERLVLAGCLMIGYTPLSHKGIKNFFRMVVTCQPPATVEDMDYVIEKIEEYAIDIV
ncbi:Glutamate decarboxylase [Gryllus bimaculatus]|nr:Glutamate decarboxylase [Gryllus bimaculatus]